MSDELCLLDDPCDGGTNSRFVSILTTYRTHVSERQFARTVPQFKNLRNHPVKFAIKVAQPDELNVSVRRKKCDALNMVLQSGNSPRRKYSSAVFVPLIKTPYQKLQRFAVTRQRCGIKGRMAHDFSFPLSDSLRANISKIQRSNALIL